MLKLELRGSLALRLQTKIVIMAAEIRLGSKGGLKGFLNCCQLLKTCGNFQPFLLNLFDLTMFEKQ